MNEQTRVLSLVLNSGIMVLITSILNLQRTLYSLLNPNNRSGVRHCLRITGIKIMLFLQEFLANRLIFHPLWPPRCPI